MTQSQSKSEIIRDDILRQLEDFSVEVLEAALRVLQVRQSESEKSRVTR